MGCPSVASMLLASFGRGGELAEMERASLAEDQTDGPRDAMRLKCMMYVVKIEDSYFVARGLRSKLLNPSITYTTLAIRP